LGHELVVDLGVAELIPGYRGDAAGGQIERGPKEGRGGQGHPGAAAGAPHHQDSQAEQAKVQPKHEAEPEQEQRRHQRRQPAVQQHGVVDPVTVAGVPEDATEIGDLEAAAQGSGLG